MGGLLLRRTCPLTHTLESLYCVGQSSYSREVHSEMFEGKGTQCLPFTLKWFRTDQ